MDDANAVEAAGVPTSALNRIDLSSSDIQQSASLLKQACLDSGFFYVINHGISQDLMEEVFAQSRRFFGLPLSEKMKLLRNEQYRGYTPLFDEVLDAANQIQGDYKEGYYIGTEVPEDDPDAQKPHLGPNLWPSEELLPRWRQTMEIFHSQALNVVKVVARIIALALDLEADFFDKPEILSKPIPILRLLHYEGIYGAGAHSDFGFITLLATDDVPGLQICKNKDAKPQAWEYVQPLKGAFIVNLGDMLERWSNCIFRSTLHRVIGNGQERYSIALFLEPNHECLVECLPTCMSEENPPKFPPILCQTYLAQRYGDTHADLDVYIKEGV
ncbi:2-oxoglutarate-Fe(II) type oxidoreductase hxnY isoform X2 [Eucalyptus grandis]|uniref:2-oxoglutarate-Fe(II) type oxidoreductase hxnY isoform X2 n=1 Tax=Eucalyptus grandis TaxID=71139 RepID=UPI00192EE59E|nr:2-oxoglutarate-Fe(II) type oxidoreductase hxnY isoform X2 [Eucalyptus grandis]